MRRFLIAIDFDGTITQHDTLHLIVDRFGDRSVWDRLTPDVIAGRVSVEEAMQAEFATVRATPDQVLELVRARAGVRDGFVEFVGWARGAGHEVRVLSNGFRMVIADTLGAPRARRPAVRFPRRGVLGGGHPPDLDRAR